MPEQVSIHAPARGATVIMPGSKRTAKVSIHAPARGATIFKSDRIRKHRCFNPRAREGRDKRYIYRKCRLVGFNPRAREGRDNEQQTTYHPGRSFNPRAREGRDWAYPKIVTSDNVSIHAPARGATTGSPSR